jgi:hypothetical protein
MTFEHAENSIRSHYWFQKRVLKNHDFEPSRAKRSTALRIEIPGHVSPASRRANQCARNSVCRAMATHPPQLERGSEHCSARAYPSSNCAARREPTDLCQCRGTRTNYSNCSARLVSLDHSVLNRKRSLGRRSQK